MTQVIVGVIAAMNLLSDAQAKPMSVPFYWVDRNVIDTLFDRVVFIAYHETKYREEYKMKKKKKKKIKIAYDHWEYNSMGVLIKSYLALTSFNPLRTASRTKKIQNMLISVMTTRNLFPSKEVSSREFQYGTVVCGRPVIPLIPEELPTDLLHGHNSPIHDLIVLRLHKPVTFTSPVPPVVYDFPDYLNWPAYGINASKRYIKSGFGPIKTTLAKPGEMPDEQKMKFASVGHVNLHHIAENRNLELGKFGAMLDCDEWLPREWGYFICMNNTENYPGLGSGAMLYSGTTLFGVGSFMLQREKSSILVFTDVRPYWDLLHRTCTEDDQNLFG